MAPAQLFPDDAGTLLADESAGAAAPSQPARRRVILNLALAFAAVVAVVGLSGLRRQQVQIVADGDLALYGEHFCHACHGAQCNCDWASAQTCAARSTDASCCWSCCCAQDGFHHFHAQAPGMIVAPDYTTGEMDRGCGLSAGQGVHVTGNSGTTYYAMVTGYSGNGLYQMSIGGGSYGMDSSRIAECQPLNALLTFWLPLLLAIVLLCIIAFCIYKKITTGKLPEPAPKPPARTCCGAQ